MVITVDRFEEGCAVCTTDEMKRVLIPVIHLPSGVKEGDILRQDKNGGYMLLILDTQEKRKELFERAEELFDDDEKDEEK